MQDRLLNVSITATLMALLTGGCYDFDTLQQDGPGQDAAAPDVPIPDQKVVPDVPIPDQKVVPDVPIPDQKVVPDKKVVLVPGTWVTIKAGNFKMGSPTSESCRYSDETPHDVKLTGKFEIQTTEVTQDQFKTVLGYNPSKFSSCGLTCPVEMVTWYEAAAYANALSGKAGLTKCYSCSGSGTSVTCQETSATKGKGIYTCKGYRLPTEAEWEYAYRAGSTTAYYNGVNDLSACSTCSSKDAKLAAIGWYCANSSSTTHPVGQKTKNAWGLYDMAGNVWEWCHDRYGTYPSTSVTDPVGTSGSSRVFRGGSWGTFADSARAADRASYGPGYRFGSLGFRLARSVP